MLQASLCSGGCLLQPWGIWILHFVWYRWGLLTMNILLLMSMAAFFFYKISPRIASTSRHYVCSVAAVADKCWWRHRTLSECSIVTGLHLLNNSQRQPTTVATALSDPSHDSVTKTQKLFCEVATKLLTTKTDTHKFNNSWQALCRVFLGMDKPWPKTGLTDIPLVIF